jgi:hypothetical protein
VSFLLALFFSKFMGRKGEKRKERNFTINKLSTLKKTTKKSKQQRRKKINQNLTIPKKRK